MTEEQETRVESDDEAREREDLAIFERSNLIPFVDVPRQERLRYGLGAWVFHKLLDGLIHELLKDTRIPKIPEGGEQNRIVTLEMPESLLMKEAYRPPLQMNENELMAHHTYFPFMYDHIAAALQVRHGKKFGISQIEMTGYSSEETCSVRITIDRAGTNVDPKAHHEHLRAVTVRRMADLAKLPLFVYDLPFFITDGNSEIMEELRHEAVLEAIKKGIIWVNPKAGRYWTSRLDLEPPHSQAFIQQFRKFLDPEHYHSQLFFSDWKVDINGTPCQIEEVNGLIRYQGGGCHLKLYYSTL